MRRLSVAVSLLAVACDEKKAEKPPEPIPIAPAPTRSAPPPAFDAAPPPRCRILSSENGPPPSADPTEWLSLADGASMTTRASESGREVRFEGPGRVLACGHAVALVAQGSALAMPGGGNAPGQEQWVASPCAVVRWTAGVTKVTANANECIVQVSTGNALLYTPPESHGENADGGFPLLDAGVADGWRRVVAPKVLRIRGVPKLEAAVAACEAAAKKVSDVDGGADLGTRTVESMHARELVRATCALAEARAQAPTEKADAGAASSSRIAKAVGDTLGSL